MTSEADEVWDRLKHGIQKTKEQEQEEFIREAQKHFNSEEFSRWKEELREEVFNAFNAGIK